MAHCSQRPILLQDSIADIESKFNMKYYQTIRYENDYAAFDPDVRFGSTNFTTERVSGYYIRLYRRPLYISTHAAEEFALVCFGDGYDEFRRSAVFYDDVCEPASADELEDFLFRGI